MKIALYGYGKMGHTIESLVRDTEDEIVLRIDRAKAQSLTVEELRQADVVIEFTQPEAAFANIKHCLEAGVPVVSGTTAWLDRLPEVEQLVALHEGAFFHAPNFSIGVNIFFALNRYLARIMEDRPEYDVRLREIHHTAKLDSPSGTAVRLAEDILAELARKTSWREADSGQPEELLIRSERIDPTPGTHEITYHSAIDAIEIRHVAHSREGFARGALAAARWLIGRRGCFGMSDMLSF
jgi:4-hydroxy-tetrahydrodipicolinate reductase